MNELRRQALDQLKETYLNKYRRRTKKEYPALGWAEAAQLKIPGLDKNVQEQKEPPERASFVCGYPQLCQEMYGNGKMARQKICLSGSIEQEEQIFPLLESSVVSRIYIDSSAFSRKETTDKLEEFFKQARKRNKKIYYILPVVFRSHTAACYQAILHDMKVDGFLVKSYDALAFLLKEAIDPKRIRLDHNLYTWSTESRNAFFGLGIEGDTVPLELNRKEVRNRNNRNSEIVIYGHQPLMTSAQCVKKNLTGCDHRPEIHYLKDRYGVFFPVKNHCNECYNVIYNSRPLQLISILEELKNFGIAAFRLSFTTESRTQAEEILEVYENHPVFQAEETPVEKRTPDVIKVEMPKLEYTYGHYKRGVE